MTKVTDYDFFGYDYANYWNNRKYENESEKILLTKIFRDKNGNWFLDIGGSYGRLSSTYYKKYTNPIILDYSLKTLLKNKEILKTKYPNIQLIAANAYKLPFKDNTFDGALMVRVLHHIEKPSAYFKELYRAMNKNSFYIQEFANKIHLISTLKALARLNFKFFSKEPYQQPTKGNFEGTKSGEEAIFFNYHPQYVKDLLVKSGFTVIKKHGCSYIRSAFLKKLFGEELMIVKERILQPLLSWSNIPPSIVYENMIKKDIIESVERTSRLEDILVCPECKGPLSIANNEAKCKKCTSLFVKENDIWDFRIK